MNHKRLFFCIGIILLIFCHALSACSLVADNEPASDLSEDTQTESETVEEVEDTERFSYSVFPQGTVQINDGKAVYNDGKISFQWDITKWYLTETNGLPMLHRADEKTDVFFCVFDCIDGTAGNLGDFSAAALKKRSRITTPINSFLSFWIPTLRRITGSALPLVITRMAMKTKRIYSRMFIPYRTARFPVSTA